MSAQSITVFKTKPKDKEEREIGVLQRKSDGRPELHGEDLARILLSLESDKVSAGTLTASVMAQFKKEAGAIDEFQAHPAGTADIGEEYVYTVTLQENAAPSIRAEHVTRGAFFDGTADHLIKAVAEAREFS